MSPNVFLEDDEGLRELLRLVAGLRRIDDEASPPRDFSRPAVPRPLLRKLRRVESAYRRLGSVGAVHRRLRISKGRVRDYLRLARALHSFGRIRATSCRAASPATRSGPSWRIG